MLTQSVEGKDFYLKKKDQLERGCYALCYVTVTQVFSKDWRAEEMAETSFKAALTRRVESLNQGLLITKKQTCRQVRQPSLAEK